MHLFVGSLLVVGGLGCLRYVWAGETAFESEPPFLALCVLLVATGVGLAMRARAALLLTRVALGGTLLVLATKAPRLYVGGPRDTADDSLVALVYLFAPALAAAVVVVLFLLLRRVRAEADFGSIDYVPLGGLTAALVLGLVWLFADDARLRPCRNGSDRASLPVGRSRAVRAAALRGRDGRRPGRPGRPGQGGVSLGLRDRSKLVRACGADAAAVDVRRAQAARGRAALAPLQRDEHARGEPLQIAALHLQGLELENHRRSPPVRHHDDGPAAGGREGV